MVLTVCLLCRFKLVLGLLLLLADLFTVVLVRHKEQFIVQQVEKAIIDCCLNCSKMTNNETRHQFY